MDAPTLVALIVALAALLVSLLQMVQQYASSAVTRGKVNRAAIGAWAKRNRYSWSFREWKLRIKYARPECSAAQCVEKMGKRSETQKAKPASILSEYNLTWVAEVAGGQGLDLRNTKLSITRRGDEAQIPLSNLTWRQRAAITTIEKEMEKSQARVSPCKATWCNLMTDLGVNPLDLYGDEYVDADTIATALDTPTMYIHMSDVVSFGFLLDMELSKFSMRERVVDMIGKHNNIATHYEQGVGMLTRYSGLAPRVPNPTASRCSPKELSFLLRTAHGMIQVGDSLAPIMTWGFNSVNHVFAAAQTSVKGEGWEEVDIRSVMYEIEPDSSIRWLGKWSTPAVPILPFLLSLCSNMAVANAFPHRHLMQWTAKQRTMASKAASHRILSGVGFTEAPTTLFENMKKENLDIVMTDDFKTANNWGCEYGGLRGWLTTNFSEFTVRMSKCWVVSKMTDKLPVLSPLKPLFVSGTLDATWGRRYNAKDNLEERRMLADSYNSPIPGTEDSYEEGRMQANSLFWLQIMMLDTWIARKVEIIMTGSAPADVSVPVDMELAAEVASMAKNAVLTSRWKATRIAFTRHYLVRLVEGVDGLASSCMSASEAMFNTEGWEQWKGMPVGNATDWADVDAALTLRAVVMVARLELMKDSSALLELRDLDPMIQMA